MSITVTVSSEQETVTLDDVRSHLRIDSDCEDAYLYSLIRAATEQAELFVRRKFVTQTIEWRLDCFKDVLYVPVAPVQSVESIVYIDTNGDQQTLSDYQSDIYSEPVRIAPEKGARFPSTDDVQNAITIEMVVGYGDAADIPWSIRQAILMMIGHYYEDREDTTTLQVREIPMSSRHLLWPYRTRLI